MLSKRRCKCVIVSDTEVMHEVYGDDVGYLDLNSTVIPPSGVLTDPKGVLDEYSWGKSAKRLYNVLKKV